MPLIFAIIAFMIKKQRTKKSSLIKKIFKRNKKETEDTAPQHDPAEISFSELDDNGLIINSGTATYGAYSLDKKDAIKIRSELDMGDIPKAQQNNSPSSEPKPEPEQEPAPENITKNLVKDSSDKNMLYLYEKEEQNGEKGDYLEIAEDGENLKLDFTSGKQGHISAKSENFEHDIVTAKLEQPINIKTDKNISLKLDNNSSWNIKLTR